MHSKDSMANKSILEAQTWTPDWQPDRNIVMWFHKMLSSLKEGAIWAAPASGQIYRVNHANKTLTLIEGDPNDSEHWHDMTKRSCAALGYRVLDSGVSNPDEMDFAESIFNALIEDNVPFSKEQVTLQYRPFKLNGAWKWYWVLLPEDRSKALAHGQEDNRAKAAMQARLKAHELGVVVGKIDLIKPYMKESDDEYDPKDIVQNYDGPNEPDLFSSVRPAEHGTVPYRIVLHRGISQYHPYVTHYQDMNNKSFEHGNYFQNYAEAVIDFEERCKKRGLNPYP